MLRRLGGSVACCLILMACGCAKPYAPDEIEHLLSQTLASAEYHLKQGRQVEAMQLAKAMEKVDADFEGLETLRQKILLETSDLYAMSLLGANRAKRYKINRMPLTRVLLYVPDRILDLFDIVSAGIHLGPGAYVDAHITRAVQVTDGMRAIAEAGWHESRCLGGVVQAEAGATLGPVACPFYVCSCAADGTSGERLGQLVLPPQIAEMAWWEKLLFWFGGWADVPLAEKCHSPKAGFYQEYRDYWAVGSSCTLAIVGCSADFHPVQFADFLAGFAGVDFLNDDFARTRGLSFRMTDRALFYEFAAVMRSPRALEAYRSMAKGAGEND